MKIALFVETYYPMVNGVVTHIKILKDGLSALGHEVLIVTADPKTKQHYINDGVLYCPALELKQIYGFGLASPWSNTRFKFIKEFNPDVFHTHHEFGIGLFAVESAKRLKKPLVYTLHSMYDEYIFYIAPKLFVPAVKEISHIYAKNFAKNASALTSPSKKAAEFFEKCKVHKPVDIIPNSVELDAFDPSQFSASELSSLRKNLNIAEDAFVAIFVGRMGKEKSIDLLLNYWHDYFLNDNKFRLLLVGSGPELENLKALSKSLNLDDSVIFTGNIDHKEIAKYFAICDIYISASLTEMMSLSMLEGMAAGLPVVQRYDKLNAEQIIEGVNGYNYHSTDEMVEIVKSLAAKAPKEKEKTKSDVRESIQSLGEKDLANHMLQIYNKCVEEFTAKKSKK